MNKLLERRFCIVGLGLLGGTYAMCLKRLGCRVTAVDIDEKAAAEYPCSEEVVTWDWMLPRLPDGTAVRP